MNLKELRDEIKESKRKLKDSSYDTNYQNHMAFKLQGIKQTIEAVDKEFGYEYKMVLQYNPIWQEIKELLK